MVGELVVPSCRIGYHVAGEDRIMVEAANSWLLSLADSREVSWEEVYDCYIHHELNKWGRAPLKVYHGKVENRQIEGGGHR